MSPHDDLARVMFDLVAGDGPQEGDDFEPEQPLADLVWSGRLFHTSFDPRLRGCSFRRVARGSALTDADRCFLDYLAKLIVRRALTHGRPQDTEQLSPIPKGQVR